MLKINFKIKIIKLRKNDKYKYILVDGTSKFNLLKNGLFEIIREYNGKKIVVYINLLNKIKNYQIPKNAKLLLSSWSDNKKSDNKLRSYESIMFYK